MERVKLGRRTGETGPRLRGELCSEDYKGEDNSD